MKFKYSIENFRGIAILFVMLSHLTSIGELPLIGKYFHFLLEDASAWFVFIAGYLFFSLEQQRFRYQDYLLKKAKFVVFPYFLLSILAIIIGFYVARDQLLQLSPVSYVFWSLLVGGSVIGPMWFMPMMFLFFLFSPVFIRLGKSKFVYLAACGGLALSFFSARSIDNLNPFFSFLHFLGFYLLGLAMSSATRSIQQIQSSKRVYLVTLFGIVLFFCAGYIFFQFSYESVGFIDDFGKLNYVQLGKFGLLVSMFFALEKFMCKHNRLFGYLAEISFGLFFIHGFYMLAFYKLTQLVSMPSVAGKVFVEFFIVIGGAMVTVWLIKFLIRKKSRYVIGC